MSQPYEPIIRHEVGPDGLVRCPGCRSGMLNRPCGDPECTCTCNAPAILEIPVPIEPFNFDNAIAYIPDDDVVDLTAASTYPENPPMEPITAELVSDPHRESGAFLLGVLMGVPIGIVGMADGLNPWVRGILIGLSVLTVLWVTGRMTRKDT